MPSGLRKQEPTGSDGSPLAEPSPSLASLHATVALMVSQPGPMERSGSPRSGASRLLGPSPNSRFPLPTASRLISRADLMGPSGLQNRGSIKSGALPPGGASPSLRYPRPAAPPCLSPVGQMERSGLPRYEAICCQETIRSGASPEAET
jgi:hypothetical protein